MDREIARARFYGVNPLKRQVLVRSTERLPPSSDMKSRVVLVEFFRHNVVDMAEPAAIWRPAETDRKARTKQQETLMDKTGVRSRRVVAASKRVSGTSSDTGRWRTVSYAFDWHLSATSAQCPKPGMRSIMATTLRHAWLAFDAAPRSVTLPYSKGCGQARQDVKDRGPCRVRRDGTSKQRSDHSALANHVTHDPELPLVPEFPWSRAD